jgi:serine/threonine-protein kinase RsbW
MPPRSTQTWKPAAPGRGDAVAHIQLVLRLPLRAPSVTTARHAIEAGLSDVGVAAECRADIAIAVSEAGNNAVEHAHVGDDFEVVVQVDRVCCVVEVIDRGVGLRGSAPEPDNPMAERGRGLHLIRAVTDEFELRRVEPRGLAVRMTKTLTWTAGPPVRWPGMRGDGWTLVRP